MTRRGARDDAFSHATLFLPIADAGGGNNRVIVAAPPPVDAAHLLPRQDSREELWRELRGDDGVAGVAEMKAKRAKRRPPADHFTSWPVLASEAARKADPATERLKTYVLRKRSVTTMDDRVAAARRVYDIQAPPSKAKRERTPPTTMVLDPLHCMHDQRARVTKQQHALARAVETRIDAASRAIPIQFLLARDRDLAARVLLRAMCRVLHSHYDRVARAALYQWKKQTLTLRILEEHDRKLFILKQTSLAHACAIVQRRILQRTAALFALWKIAAERLRVLEQNRYARRIQKCWRAWRMQQKLKTLDLLCRDRVRHASAVQIQSAVRCFLARCEMARVVWQHHRHVAAIRIQTAFRQFLIVQIAKRHRQSMAAGTVQRVWRGYVGRCRAHRRRRVCRHAVESVYDQVWLRLAINSTLSKHACAAQIQRCCRAFVYCRRINRGIKRSECRRHFFPALRIQRGWLCYRDHQLRFVAESIVFRVIMTHLAAARRIQHCFRTYWTMKTNRAALRVTQLFRRFDAKKKMVHGLIIPWLQQWKLSRLDPWCVACASDNSTWRQTLVRFRDHVEQFKDAQTSALRRLNVSAGLHRTHQCCRFDLDFICAHATAIQRAWRWYRLLSLVSRLREASILLKRAIPTLFRQYKRRKQRHRVLQRWKRQRYVELRGRFDHWKTQHFLLLEARDLATTTRKLRKALWFHHHKVRQRMMRRWWKHVLQRRTKQVKERSAVVHDRSTKTRRAWRAWVDDALPGLCVWNRLHEVAMTLTMWKTWKAFVECKMRTKLARAHRCNFVKRVAMAEWQRDRVDFYAQIVVANRYRDEHARSHAFHALVGHVRKMKQVRAFSKDKQQARGVYRWLAWMCKVQHDRGAQLRADQLRREQLAQSAWRQWRLYVDYRAHQKRIRQDMELHYKRRHLRTAVTTWSRELVPMWKDYKLIDSVANIYRHRKVKERYFRQGLAVFWTLTAGARRTAMAIRIQRAYRAKRARRRIFVMRMKIRYQLETRATAGVDVKAFTTTALRESLDTHDWVFVLFSLPWAPVGPDVKEAFNKTATTWTYLRSQAHRIAFGVANATDVIALPSQEFSLMTWLGLQPRRLPCVVGFWRGVGPAQYITDSTCRLVTGETIELKRRWRVVCGESRDSATSLLYPNTPETAEPRAQVWLMSRLVAWIERLQQSAVEAAVVDLQSYVRGFLMRRHMKRYRILKKERQGQRVREWIRLLTAKWVNTKRQHAASTLQRWVRHVQERRRFWAALRKEMQTAKQAILRVQRATRIHLVRVRVRLALVSLLATPLRYPNAPLCQECFGVSETLARLLCRDCDQTYCADCFGKTHRSGKRMLHVCDTVDFVAMNEPSTKMCRCCEVRGATRACRTCISADGSSESQVMCLGCFERKHTDERGNHSGGGLFLRRHRSWWASTAFKSHAWSRVAGAADRTSENALTALDVMEKYDWQSRNLVIRKQKEALQVEESLREREERLLAIRLQQEAILRDAFDRFDTDKSGAIDRDEFKRMFREELCEPLSDEQADEAMKVMDKSGNGLIEFDELLAWFAEEALAKEESGAAQVADPRSLAMLKDALRAKRQMRRYKEKLNELVPSVSLRVAPPQALVGVLAQIAERKLKKKTVPGFPSVECLERGDYASKRKVFYRFMHEICGLHWIYEDEQTIPVANAMDVFEQTFIPRWNAGELTYDFYFDDESFEFEGEDWQRRWNAETKRYEFVTARRKRIRLDRSAADRTSSKRRRKRSSLKTGNDDVAVVEVEEEVEIVEAIDPRRKQMLLEEAQEAFKKADADGSGYVDEEEFHRMLTRELCEPITKAKARQIMKQLDADGSGKIDFHEFFQWYAVDKCQDYPLTRQTERAKALLKTRRRAEATAAAAMRASVSTGLHLKATIDRKRKEQQLLNDCKGASPELIDLLQEGFPKLLAEKALVLHNNELAFARKWLQDKQRAEQAEHDGAVRAQADRKAQRKKYARAKKLKRRQRIAAARKTIKSLLIGSSKKEAHAARVEQALTNLDREIQLVERQLIL